MTVTIIIPARYGATRFPGKPLVELWGKPLVQHVYERACQAQTAQRVLIATDDDRIAAAARAFGAEVAMTRADHPSGTDRVAEAASGLVTDLVVNVQGDEPLIDPSHIDAAVAPLLADTSIPMGTLCSPLETVTEIANPNVVKVVFDQAGNALYFSRFPIPFARDQAADAARFRHLGLYVYRKEFLLQLGQLSPTPLEQAEKLEQLRVLEHGYKIHVTVVSHTSPGVDTPEDLGAPAGDEAVTPRDRLALFLSRFHFRLSTFNSPLSRRRRAVVFAFLIPSARKCRSRPPRSFHFKSQIPNLKSPLPVYSSSSPVHRWQVLLPSAVPTFNYQLSTITPQAPRLLGHSWEPSLA